MQNFITIGSVVYERIEDKQTNILVFFIYIDIFFPIIDYVIIPNAMRMMGNLPSRCVTDRFCGLGIPDKIISKFTH
jgi:hypothetical protein